VKKINQYFKIIIIIKKKNYIKFIIKNDFANHFDNKSLKKVRIYYIITKILIKLLNNEINIDFN